jgi:hypothetical protein
MTKYKRDYYRVTVPGDLAGDIETLGQHAIGEAKERARLYCVPCEWSARLIDGGIGDFAVVFRVRRTRRSLPAR